MRARLLTALLCLSLVALGAASACTRGTEGKKVDRPVGITAGFQAPDFTLPVLGDKSTFTLSQQRGKVVLVTFWASWCGPCRAEVPALEGAWKHYQTRDAVFVGISLDDTERQAHGFLRQAPASYPMLLDVAGRRVGNPWRAQQIPLTVVIDKEGVVRERHVGFSPQGLRQSLALVDQLLEE